MGSNGQGIKCTGIIRKRIWNCQNCDSLEYEIYSMILIQRFATLCKTTGLRKEDGCDILHIFIRGNYRQFLVSQNIERLLVQITVNTFSNFPSHLPKTTNTCCLRVMWHVFYLSNHNQYENKVAIFVLSWWKCVEASNFGGPIEPSTCTIVANEGSWGKFYNFPV